MLPDYIALLFKRNKNYKEKIENISKTGKVFKIPYEG
jgi:hypothetical protein